MQEFLTALRDMGPFTTPLCLGMGYAVWWIAGQFKAERGENKALLLKLAEIQTQNATDYAEYGEAMRDVLRENAASIQAFNQRAVEVLRAASR
jgi:hypothetical protein